MQQQGPSIGSLLLISVAGFIGLGVVGFVILVLLSALGPWIMLLPVIALAALCVAVLVRRRQRNRANPPA